MTTINNAAARFTEPMDTTAEKITGAGVHIAAIKASPSWGAPTATDVQAAVKFWGDETDNLTKGETLISALEKQLAAAYSTQRINLRRWRMRRQGVLTAINVFCDGSRDTMATFGVAIADPGPHVDAAVPVGLESTRSLKTGVASVAWFGTPKNRNGFMVQHATDPADPATYSAPIPCSKRSFQLPGQTPGATIYFRVLAQDPNLPGGQTAWTAWVAATASL